MSFPGAGLAESLERGELIYHPVCPFSIPDEAERAFLATQDLGGSVHKNISYDPVRNRLHGFARQSSEQSDRLHRILADFSDSVTSWLAEQIPAYSRKWELDRVSYRPLEESTRNLRLNARNDLLHVDAFPTRPTHGWRILRVFVNLNPTEPRVWVTSDTFGKLLERYGDAAGLPSQGFSLTKAFGMLRQVPQLFRPGRRRGTDYDAFMVRFHNFLKASEEFQEHCVKRLWTFPPGSAWLAMTDTLTHAVLRGRYALEHSYFIAPETQAVPDESPAALLAKACGFAVLPRAA